MAESAGLKLDESRPYVTKNVIKVLSEKGDKIKIKEPRQLTSKIAEKSDLIIITADNIDKKFFSDLCVKVEKWKIPDTSESNIKEIKMIINQIERKVKKLTCDIKV